MQNAVMNRGIFRWCIYNPFLPWKNLEATFYLGSPTITQWKVTLKPDDRRLNYRKFSLSLEFDEWFHPEDDIVAEKVLVIIKLNGRLHSRKDVRNYRFNKDIQFTYNFQSIVTMDPQIEPHVLEVRIEISLPGRSIRKLESGLFQEHNDLRWLSEDLAKLLVSQKYSNMKLLSKNVSDPIRVHSYIINARWDNFFKLHDFAVNTRDTVQTNISRALLMDILSYIYTGAINRHWPDWQDVAYCAELFQVIDRYKLYHLYKVLVKSDLQQVRETTTPVLIESHLFPLDIAPNRVINNDTYTWCIDEDPEYKFIFRLRLWNDRKTGPRLSYSLESKSESRVFAEVNLEITKGENENSLQRVVHFHGRGFTIDPNEIVEYRCVLLQGCNQTWGSLISVSSDEIEIKYFIQCFLHVVKGNAVIQVKSEHWSRLQGDAIRLNVLSEHMHKLRIERVDTDMDFLTRQGTQQLIAHHVHKGIIATRLPGIENCLPEDSIPDTALFSLSFAALLVILDYLYTGKILTIPFSSIDEIENFAEQTLSYSLIDWVKRLRSAWMNQ